MSNNDTKRRRVGADGATISTDSNNYGLVCEELKDIKSTMNEMMENTRLQTQNMTNMMQMMKSMQGEIAHLTNECNEMKHIIHETKNRCVDSGTSISTMNSRFDDVDIKLKYHEILLKNQQWKYSAPRPSEEYWDGLEDEDEAADAEEFLKEIKQRTEEMRYGIGEGNINIDVMLPYNGECQPHWEEFANALEQYQYRLKCLPKDTDTALGLFYMELPNEVVELLSKALESTHFTGFTLRDNSLGQSGIDFALEYLQRNCILSFFSLCDNTINSMKDIEQLCEIVEAHPSIDALSLVKCRGADVDGYEMLQMIMTAGKIKLKVLNLSQNGISTGGDTFISDFLAGNPMLKTLWLNGNQLDDNDAIAIAGALKHNKNLRSLDVKNNRKISKAGWLALRKAEFDETSLNSAADSNHTCLIEYQLLQGLGISEINGDDSDYCFAPMYVRQKKIYTVLSSRNRGCTNVGHFNDVPVELLPDILSSIERYSEYHIHDHAPPQSANDVKPISLMLEILQRWDKSLAVFESLSS